MADFRCALLLMLFLPASAGAGPATVPATSPSIDVRVDPRVELICIIFRLAGHPEYSRAQLPAYAADVDKHFAPFKDHPVVALARELRRTRGVSFEAPMSLAAHVTAPPALAERVAFDPHPVGLDARWRLVESRRFLQLARDFAGKARFAAFFDAHRDLYAASERAMRVTIARHVKLDWFERYFGAAPGAGFHLVIAPLNGGNCYGIRVALPDNASDLYSIMGVWQTDPKGAPAFPASVVPTIIHEFNHAFVNPVVYTHQDKFAPAGQRLFEKHADVMRRQAYGHWTTVLHESIVRAAVVRYLAQTAGPDAARAQLADETARGFTWTADLVALLQQYEQSRDKYPTLDYFHPRLVEFFETQAPATQPANP